MNKILTVATCYPVKPQPKEEAWQNQGRKEDPASLVHTRQWGGLLLAFWAFTPLL